MSEKPSNPSPPDRQQFDLPKPVPAEHESLPHAAMSLGAPAHAPRMVARLVLEKTGRMWMLYRLDEGGGFVGDSLHGTRQDALHQAQREFGLQIDLHQDEESGQ